MKPPPRALTLMHRWYYENAGATWKNTRWLGVETHKNPCDLWVYQELITQVRPAFIIECGTLYGGSALFLATVCDALGLNTMIITIDRELQPHRPQHRLITYLQGDTMDGDILADMENNIDGASALVILDDDHTAPHVLDELRAYSHWVTPGSYLVVEDTNLGHEAWPDFGPGPREALVQWLAEDKPPFTIDRGCEKHGLTFHTWLRREAP